MKLISVNYNNDIYQKGGAIKQLMMYRECRVNDDVRCILYWRK